MGNKKFTEEAINGIGWQHRALAEMIRDVVWTMKLDSRLSYVSPSVTAQTGFLPEEYLMEPVDKFLTPESAARVREIIGRELALPPGQRIDSLMLELQQYTKAGAIIDVETNASWIYSEDGIPIGIIGITRDITARKRAEQALRESEERFRALVALSSEGIVVHEDGVIIGANQAAATLLGFSNPESMIGQYGLGNIEYAPASEEPPKSNAEYSMEAREAAILRPDGTRICALVREHQTILRGRQVRIVSLLDVTERKRIEEERVLSGRRLEALLELNQMSATASIHDLTHFAMEEGVSLTGSSIGYVAFANEDESVLTMYSWSKAAMEECAISDKPNVYALNTTGLWGEPIRQRHPVITNDYAAGNPWKKGLPEGHVHIARHMNVPIFDGNRIVIVAGVGNKPEEYDEGDVRQLTLLMEGLWRIISRRHAEADRQRLQEQLDQASKMEAIGRLAGGVAHDFNNLLTSILGYSEMILNHLAKDDPIKSEIEEISKAGKRAASLTQQLLAFSRKQVILPRVIQLNGVVNEARKMLERLIGENIKLVFNLDENLGRVKADPHQIDQVLLNLAVNARDAMPDGGTLTLSTENVTVESGQASPHSEIAPGSYVVLSVKDTGTGMSEEIKKRAFEPFFSTKAFGKGTGLGLAMVYGIAKQNGGTITVDSEPECGTLFRFFLPRAEEMSTEKAASEPMASPTGDETILLVEDDIMVQRLAQRILSHLGYKVIQAHDTDDAMRICREFPETIHLLLTDVIMPGMNGVELYDQMQKERAEMKALFMSGYAESFVVRKGVLPEGMHYIQKPFNMEGLATCVRQALDMHKASNC